MMIEFLPRLRSGTLKDLDRSAEIKFFRHRANSIIARSDPKRSNNRVRAFGEGACDAVGSVELRGFGVDEDALVQSAVKYQFGRGFHPGAPAVQASLLPGQLAWPAFDLLRQGSWRKCATRFQLGCEQIG